MENIIGLLKEIFYFNKKESSIIGLKNYKTETKNKTRNANSINIQTIHKPKTLKISELMRKSNV